MGQGPSAPDLRYLRHQGWTTEDGLPQDSVHGVVQTGDGYLWVGTEGGLARFDGVSFRVFGRANAPGFASDDICCLLRAEGDGLWVGTADGLLLVRAGGERVERFGVREGLPSSTVLGLRAGAGGVVVETAAGDAAWRGGRFGGVRGGAGDDARWVDGGWGADVSGVWWTEGRRRQGWTVGKELAGSRVESLLRDPAEGVERAWVGTNAGLFLVTAGRPEVAEAPWLKGDAVLALARDREGDVWVGTENSGLHVLRRVRFRTEAGMGGEGVVALVESRGTVWVGSRRDGLRAFRDGSVVEVGRGKMTSSVVLSLSPAAGGGVWVGTPDGLNRVEAGGQVRGMTSAEGLPDDYILALEGDGSGGVWAGTRRGLAHVDAGMRGVEVLTQEEGLAGDLVGSLLRTRAGEMWVGTSGGVSRLGVDGRVRGVTMPGARGVVRAMAEGGDGAVWLATSEGWVSRVEGGVVEGVRGPVVGEAVDGVVEDGGVVWLRTGRGIAAMREGEFSRCVREGCVPAVTGYGVADGMPSAEVVAAGQPVAWRMANGELWFGTRHGVAVVDPSMEMRVEEAPPVAVERFTADGVALPAGRGPVEVAWGRTRFTVEYAGLSFRAPSKVRYRYRLEGFDGGWTEAGGRRSATYTNLRPGRYRFAVEAALGDGGWGGPGAELTFRVIPPIYRRWWFLLLLAVCGAGLVAGLYLLRLRRLRREFEAVLRERNRMAREIHDTLAQDFVGVSLKLDIALQMLGMRKVEAAVEQLRETRVLVTEGLQEARQSIWGLRANAAADSLPARLTKVAERFRSGGMTVRLKVGGAYRRLDGRVEAEVVRVGQEALENVRRHAGVAEAEVELRYRRDMLVLTVTDEGRGFRMSEAERRDGHYGVRGMQERAAAAGGRLEVRSAVGEGTRVEMVCPIDGMDGGADGGEAEG